MGARQTGRSRVLAPCLLLAAGLALAGCAQVIDGRAEGGGLPSPQSPSSSTGPTAPTGFPSTTTPASPTSTDPSTPTPTVSSSTPVASPTTPANPAGLLALVEAAPAGSRPGTTAWDNLPTPTPAQFVHEYYDKKDWDSEYALLNGEGLVRTAHRVWTASDGVYGDIILLQYKSSTGALTRYLGVTGATRKEKGESEVQLSGQGLPVAFVPSAKDSDGNTVVATYAVVGSIVVELHTFNKGTWNRGDVQSWISEQTPALP